MPVFIKLKLNKRMKKNILGLLFVLCCNTISQAQNQPNIIYILADDMGSGDVMVYNKEAKFPTPHIDKMASEGVMFTDVHTSSSVCTPTRYGIITGRYSWRTPLKSGVTQGWSDHIIDTERTTVASYLKAKGYATAMIGKWHLGMDWTSKDGKKVNKRGANVDLKAPIKNGPNAVGFDYYYGISASLNMDPHAYIENTILQGDDLRFFTDTKEVNKILGSGGKAGWLDMSFKRDEVMQTFTNKAISWMKEVTAKKEPFFLYFPLNAPHSPIVPSDKFKGKSGLSDHGDFCMDVDDTVGQIIAAVEEMGLSENTLIVFTADNGVSPRANLKAMADQGHFSSYIYRGLKGSLYEGGHRVPFVVKWPKKIKKSFETDYLSCTTDLLATVADLLGDKLPDNVGEDSRSFLPVLLGEKKEDSYRGAIVHHSDAGVFSIRKDQWKLIFDKGAGSRRSDPKDKPVINPGEIQLFNMESDVVESTNVASSNPEVVEELKKIMASFINNGRSTNGEIQQNDPSPRGWKNLDHFEKYIIK